jgi:hypothetical protein
MGQISNYTKYGLDRETWVALCSLILTGPLPKHTVAWENGYETLVARHYAAVIEVVTVLSLGATPEGARLFCQCLDVSTVQEGIAYLQAMNVLHQASHMP